MRATSIDRDPSRATSLMIAKSRTPRDVPRSQLSSSLSTSAAVILGGQASGSRLAAAATARSQDSTQARRIWWWSLYVTTTPPSRFSVALQKIWQVTSPRSPKVRLEYKPVAAPLDDLHISQSHSRPHVSNDNFYSEAQSKTLKYCPVFPGQFGSIHDARAFSEPFFDYYNNHHRHSGIGLYTPASVHGDTAITIRACRQHVLDGAFAASCHRFHERRL